MAPLSSKIPQEARFFGSAETSDPEAPSRFRRRREPSWPGDEGDDAGRGLGALPEVPDADEDDCPPRGELI